jgi:hypothetical protein
MAFIVTQRYCKQFFKHFGNPNQQRREDDVYGRDQGSGNHFDQRLEAWNWTSPQGQKGKLTE